MPVTLLLAFGVWLGFILLCRWIGGRYLVEGPRGEPVTGLLWLVVRAYSRLMHRPTYVGIEHVPKTNHPGGLVVVANHTNPVDPLLIQAACRFEIRWMMAANMMIRQLDWVWRRQHIIPVARDGRDTSSLRTAIRHVKGGGVIGIFPEGGIPVPRGEIRPFHEGVGVIIARTRAPVLLVWVSGTSEAIDMFPAVVTPSRSRVQFVDMLDFSDQRDPALITATLRRRVAEVSGWPLNDDPMPVVNGSVDPFAV